MNETALFIVGAFVSAIGVAGAIVYGRLVFERWSDEQKALPNSASVSPEASD